jgi:phosphoglycolate phosphatase-like HAD superfamily hydrolase
MLAAHRAIAFDFDFDGTLVDSAPGILLALFLALGSNRMGRVLPLDRSAASP